MLWTKHLFPLKIHMLKLLFPMEWYLEMRIYKVIGSGVWNLLSADPILKSQSSENFKESLYQEPDFQPRNV